MSGEEKKITEPGCTQFIKATKGTKPLWYWAAVCAWMVTIFSASTDLMAHSNTSKFVQPFLHWLFPNRAKEFYLTAHFYIRKGAHLTEYAILATLLYWAFGRRALPAFLVALFFAMGDEWHQSFVPSRSGAVMDVVIDATGALLALIFWKGFDNYRHRRKGQAAKAVTTL